MKSIESTINELFARSERVLKEKTAFFDANDFYIFGAGNMGREALSAFRKAGAEPRGFIDDTPGKLGTVVDDLRVFGDMPSETSTVFVCVHNPRHDFLKSRERFGDRSLSFMHIPWIFPQVSFAHAAHPESYLRFKDEIIAVYKALGDETSRATFVEQLTFRLTLDWNFTHHSITPYFPPDIGLPFDQKLNFIDAGAFDGDTVKLFLERFPRPGKVVAIEADPRNFAKLETYLSNLDVDHVMHNAAVDGQDGILKFDATGDMAARLSDNGQLLVRSHTLNHFMDGIPDPCYVKFDVEGAESAILKESKDLLQKRRPILAVSIYHHAADMIEIPLQLHQLGYRIEMRYHGIDGADLVLYAFPAK